MTLHEYRDLEQRSEEWLALRCGMVTASVVGQLVTSKARTAIDYACSGCGATAGFPCAGKRTGQPIATLHPERAETARADDSPPTLVLADNETTRGLAALLAAESIAGPDPDSTFINRDMWRGIEAEPYAREKYAEHYGTEVTECGFMVLEEDDWSLGYSPDGLVGDEGLVEIKSPRRKGHLETVVNGTVPAAHAAQIQAGLLVSGREWCDFVSFNGGMRMWVTRVLPDPAWHKAITAAVAEFNTTVNQMVETYSARVEGFPMTERIDTEVYA